MSFNLEMFIEDLNSIIKHELLTADEKLKALKAFIESQQKYFRIYDTL